MDTSRDTTDSSQSILFPARRHWAGRLRRPATLVVVSGRLWITHAGDATDYFVAAGQRHRLPPGTAVVISADLPSAFLVEPEPQARRPAWRPRLGLSWAFLRPGRRPAPWDRSTSVWPRPTS
jgi:hypothetical protein